MPLKTSTHEFRTILRPKEGCVLIEVWRHEPFFPFAADELVRATPEELLALAKFLTEAAVACEVEMK